MTDEAERAAAYRDSIPRLMREGAIPADAGTLEIAEIAFIAGYRAGRGEWISVKERLPHQVGCSGPYLVWYQEQPGLLPIQSGIGLCHFDARETPQWSSNLGAHVTHWTHPPPPPKGEK